MLRRKVLVILVAMALSLSACGSPASTKQASTDNPLQRETEEEKTKPTILEEKTVTDKEMVITAAGDSGFYEAFGTYTGEVKNGKPNGRGKWVYGENNEEYHWEYEGNFVDGIFEGKGKEIIKDAEIGIILEYTGDFADGQYNGNGKNVITDIDDDDIVVCMEGTFTKGKYTPTASEAFSYFGQLTPFGSFRLTDEQAEYIDSHKELFPTCEKATADATELVNFSYKQFTKTRKQEETGLIKLKLTAQQVLEDDILDGKLTSLLARDTDNNYYSVYYRDSVEVYDGDPFTVYAVPCGTSSFDNVGGGTTSVVVLLACYMQ